MKRAVLIGINYFNTSSELAGCLNDINDIHKYMYPIGFELTRVLTDSKDDPKHLAPNSPTRANIIAALREAVTETLPGDFLYIHYSGHGSYSRDYNGDERDGRDECICPVDYETTGMIYDDELNDILIKKLPLGARLRAVFDCCHSGTALDLPVRWVAGKHFSTENQMTNEKDIMFISGCKDSQTSADASFSRRANGALTWALLRVLKNCLREQIVPTWKTLGELMREKLKDEGFDQVPQLCMSNAEQMGCRIDLL